MANNRVWTEEYKVDGDTLRMTLDELIREGKARRIIVKNARGRTVLRIPLLLGALSVLKNSSLLALTAYGAMSGKYTVIVEKEGEQDSAG